VANPGAAPFLTKESNVPEALFSMPVRVYWEDTDAGGVVFYANYLKYFERARTEWLRALGIAQSSLQTAQDCVFVVAEVQLRYIASARLDDLLSITVALHEQGSASLRLQQEAWRGDTLLAQAQVRVGCVSASSMRPRRMPAELLARLKDASAA